MKYRATFLVGAAVGYVLGAHAGRERYEQIKRLSRKLAENSTVQETAGVLRAQAGQVAGSAREKVTARVHAQHNGHSTNGHSTNGHGPA